MQFASMSLGIFDFLIEWLTQFLIWIVEFALGIVQQLIAGILYSTCVNFLEIVNYIQKIFYKLCGLDTYWAGGTEMKGTDPLISIITEKSMLQVLLALTLVAVAMVIVATIIQVLRTEFSTEGSKNTKGQVFGQAIKAVIMFALVPICSAGGILITNALLKAVNTATSLGAESSVGGAIYVASTYGSNKIRNGGTITIVENNITVVGAETGLFGSSQKTKTITVDDTLKQNLAKLGIASSVNQTNRDDVAQAIDNAFRSGYFDFKNHEVAKCFYDVGSINYIIFIGGGLLAAYTMLMASFGMIMRMYKGAVLFVISPAMTGLMPLDNGNAFKEWRKAFIKQLLSAYGTIVAMNLLFILLPIVSNINLFGSTDFNGTTLSDDVGKINAFVQMLFALTGLFMLKDMSGIIASLIGADDAATVGADKAGKVLSTAAKIGTVAAGGAGLAMKGLGATAGIAGNVLSKNNPNSKLGKALSMTSKSFGSIGGKMTQRAKGTAGKALNKISNVATGGEFKGPFSEETDFGRAKDAKEKKAKERNERLENGEGSLGDLMSKGVDTAKKATGKVAGGAIGGLVGGASNLVSKAVYKYNEMQYGMPMPEVGSFKDALKEGASEGYGSVDKGIGKTYSERYASHQAASAVGQMTVDNLKTSYGKVEQSISGGKIAKIVDSLKSGDSLAANDQISAMLEALNSIADKTEDQKDLIQKLTMTQSQINSSAGNKDALTSLADSSLLKTLQSKATDVNKEASAVVSVTSNTTINNDTDINSQLASMGEQIADKVNNNSKHLTGEKLDALRNEMKVLVGKVQQANLEAAKAKKEKK